MTNLISTASLILLMAACIGAGGAILRLLRIAPELRMQERVVWSFPVGLAALGWVLFFPAVWGWLSVTVLLSICLAAALCVGFLAVSAPPDTKLTPNFDRVTWCLLAVGAIILGVDLLESLSPPADADTLAYHFALPKYHLTAGKLQFIPRAIDGSPPQLIHMTYMAALGLGGERALTLWTMVSGWMTAALVFVFCRRFLSLNWSLALTLVYLSTPTVLQTGGSGQIEPRLAQFALIGAIACGISANRNCLRYAALAGICAGAFAAAKFTGLFFGAAGAFGLLLAAGRMKRLLVYAVAAGLVGFQWYFWTWYNTGDPVFPLLFGVLGVNDPSLWSVAQDAVFRDWLARIETPLPVTPWWFALYPLYVTFVYDPLLETGRTGMGIFPLLAAPFAAAWIVQNWSRRQASILFIPAIIMTAFLMFWFFSGSPQRVRHLLPVFPLALLCLAVPAVRWAEKADMRAPLITGISICLAVQIAGQALFGWNYAAHVFSGETREAFLRRNVSMYAMVPWLNSNLDRNSRVLTFERQLLYLLNMPAVMSHPILQRSLNFETLRDRPGQIFDELQTAGITHLLDTGRLAGDPVAKPEPAHEVVRRLLRARCLVETHRDRGVPISSRTLGWKTAPTRWVFLYALTPGSCRL